MNLNKSESEADTLDKVRQASFFFCHTYFCLANNKLLPKMNLNKSESEADSDFIMALCHLNTFISFPR